MAEACSDSLVRRIRFYRDWFLRIEDDQNGLCREARFQLLKRFLGLEIPFERLILLGQVRQGCSNLGVILNKLPVEVRETKTGLDFFYYHWFRLTRNGFDLLRVYFKSFSGYDVSEELDFLLIEFRLFYLDA